ncbi:MAG TPA: alginate lyase family protein [Armatimonadota bacterium]|nr:alginate lyase family protein [Armatimonadota bacterium]
MTAFCLSLALTASSALADVGRPEYSRADLPELKKLDRAGVFAALGSFDERGLTDDEFVAEALNLLDPDSVPGLADAQQANDWRAALDAVYEACRAGRGVPVQAPASASALATADEALEHRFTFYGEKHQLPADIDWNVNPGTGHWGHDLNRFTYISSLVRAYVGTGDERYSRKTVELILDWAAKCEQEKCFNGTPYVWGSYLNNAIHSQAWCSRVSTLVAADQITPLELLRVLKSVHDQLAYLEIVTNKHAGNWPTIGMQGMLTCLGTFPIFRDTDRFADYCTREFSKQVAAQVLPDGVQDELTPHYHRVVISNLLNALHWLRVLDRDLDPATMATLGKMLHYTQQTTVPDGSKQAGFNDSDPGSSGSYAGRLADMGLSEMVTPPEELGPEVFPYAGVAFLRQRQDVGDLYLAFDGGPYGRSHQHEDKLGFWLFAYGRNLIVDPGRHLYDHSETSYYPYLKSTTAHSTIRVDGQGQHSRGRRDTWIAKEPIDLGWQVADGEIRASGTYDLGYGPDNDISVVHRREVVFVGERFWVVFDVVEGEGEHHVESRFQFAPGNLTIDGTGARTAFADANLLLSTKATAALADVHIEKGQENPRGGWYSDGYNQIEPAPALSMSLRTELPWRAATLLFPYEGTDAPAVEFSFDGRHATVSATALGVGETEVECLLP